MNVDQPNLLESIEIGTGTWQWGDKIVWGFGRGYDDSDARAAFDASLSKGICFFDTAEMYGFGQSERLVGQFMRDAQQPITVATKFMPLPWRLTRGSLRSALHRSLKRLDIQQVDLYQIHWPTPPIKVEARAEALADIVEAGLTRAVGVSNYSRGQMQRTCDVLAKRGIKLTSNQVEYNLLKRNAERSGLLARCQEIGIRLIAYSPLGMGLLTGKYTPDNLPPGIRRRNYYGQRVAKVQPLIKLMREIGEAHGGKIPAQVALNWTICKGALPIPGAKNAQQVAQNAGARGWQLTDEEIARLDEASDQLTRG
jgi:aryl-alcohol dehydrogenase-like predicted oxidoreductase